MKITLSNTTVFETIKGAKTRAWIGKTEGGIPIVAYIAAIQIDKDRNQAEFEAELNEVALEPPKSAELLEAMAGDLVADPRQMALDLGGELGNAGAGRCMPAGGLHA